MRSSQRALSRKKDSTSDLEGSDSDSEYQMQENSEERGKDESDIEAIDEDENDESKMDSTDEEENEDGESPGEGEDEKEHKYNYEDAEMKDLEKKYEDLHSQELDILKNLKRQKDEDCLKGQAVKNQKALWDKNLELRFLLQKPFSSSNRLPLYPVRSLFCDFDEEIVESYADLISSSKKTLESLIELQEALLEKNPSVSSSSDAKLSKNSKNMEAESDEEWEQVSQMYKRLAAFRDKSVDKWQRKTQVTTGAAAIKGKLQAFNQNVSEQVAAYMRDPSRMVKQMQLRRPTVGVFGQVWEGTKNATVEGVNDADPELLDDTEFYQQLLKEFFEAIDPSSTETAFYALKRSRTRKRIVDHRASKSRKIRYNVHEKIVNFMAPEPRKIPDMAPKLFENLFGLKSQQKSESIVKSY